MQKMTRSVIRIIHLFFILPFFSCCLSLCNCFANIIIFLVLFYAKIYLFDLCILFFVVSVFFVVMGLGFCVCGFARYGIF